MPRFFKTPPSAASGVDTDLPEHWLDGKYSSSITKSHLTVAALAFASGVSFFAGLSAFSNGIPMLAIVCFGGTIAGLRAANATIDKLKSWQWVDRKRAHEYELDLVTLQNDHATLKYHYCCLAETVRRGEAEGAAGDGAPSADIVDLNGRRTH